MRKWFDIATITNKKGLDGGLVLYIRTGLSDYLTPGLHCYFAPPLTDISREATIDEVMVTGQDSAIVYFDDICDIDSAEALVGAHILIEADVLERKLASKEATISQAATAAAFLNWKLVDTNTGYVGIVKFAEERFEQVLLEVEREDGSIVLVPCVNDLLDKIDTEHATLVMRCPAGLFEM